MPVATEFFPFGGGLDIVSPYFQLPQGALIECLNYEQLPEGGYRRIDGYRLYDGTTDPAVVPGNGIIRGVFIFNGDRYAIRDQESAGGLFKATETGWDEVDLGSSIDFDAGVSDFVEGETITGGTSGATAVVERVVFAGGTNGVGDSHGRLTLSGVTGTFVDDENLSSGATLRAVADGAMFDNALPLGGRYRLDTHNFYGQDGQGAVYGANGVGDVFEFDGTIFSLIKTDVASVYPVIVLEHKEHLFLFYAGGSIVSSAPGNPLIFDAILGAAEIAVGDAINSAKSLPGGVLAIGCNDTIKMLYGNDFDSWQLQKFTDHGVKAYSFGEVGGNTLVLDDRGVQNLATTQAYGDFEATAISRKVNPLLLSLRDDIQPTASIVSKNKSQYRLFFGTDGFYFTFAGSQLAGITPVRFDDAVLCTASGEDDNGKEILIFGSTDGGVYEMNKSYKFDTGNILAYLRFPFIFQRAPTSRKQYRKAVLDLFAEGDSAQLLISADFGFGSDDSPSSLINEALVAASNGGQWDFSQWDNFIWDAGTQSLADVGLIGIGRNMSMSIVSLGEEDGGHTFYGATIHYSQRRLDR
ncbi:MAG: hypothetical protein ACJA1I_000498 [Zhongshania marina]|jgi:hypothetical protein